MVVSERASTPEEEREAAKSATALFLFCFYLKIKKKISRYKPENKTLYLFAQARLLLSALRRQFDIPISVPVPTLKERAKRSRRIVCAKLYQGPESVSN